MESLNLKGDTLLNSELEAELPQFRLYEEKARAAYAREDKTAVDLNQAAEMVKSDKVIISSLSEALVSGEIPLETFWYSTQGVVVESMSVVIVFLIVNGVYLLYTQRKLAIALALLQAHVKSTRAQETLFKLKYVASTNMPTKENHNCTEHDALQNLIINVSSSISPQILAVLALLLIAGVLAWKLVRRFYNGSVTSSTWLALEFNIGNKSEFVNLISINGQIGDFESTAKDYIKNISVSGTIRPRIHFKWASFKITNLVTKHSYSLEESYPVSWRNAKQLREILKKAFICVPVLIKRNEIVRLHVRQSRNTVGSPADLQETRVAQ